MAKPTVFSQFYSEMPCLLRKEKKDKYQKISKKRSMYRRDDLIALEEVIDFTRHFFVFEERRKIKYFVFKFIIP